MTLIAELFKKSASMDDFRQALLELDGAFPFEKEDMIEIGQTYEEIYPDCRDATHYCQQVVQLGYTLVRVCAVEHLIRDLDGDLKKIFREMFFQVPGIEANVKLLIGMLGRERLTDLSKTINLRIQEIVVMVDQFPQSIVKEKFSGGMASLVNVDYLIRHAIEKSQPM